MREVVEHESTDGDLAQVELPGGTGQVVDLGALRVEGKRDIGQEATRFVLHFAQSCEVVDLLLGVFHMSVEHGGVRRQATAMCGGGDLKPVFTVGLGPEQVLVDTIGEDLSAASWNGLEAGLPEIGEHLLDGFLRQPMNLSDLDHREGLQMGLRARPLHGAEYVQVVLVRQLRVHPAHHVDFRDRHVGILPDPFGYLFGLENVPPLVIRLHIERAEPTQLVAHIRVVDVLIADVVRRVAMACFPHQVGQVAEGGQIGAVVQTQTIRRRQALASHDLRVHIGQTGVVKLLEDQAGVRVNGIRE